MHYLLYLFGFYGIIIFIQYLVVFLRLKKASIQYPTYTLTTIEQVPKHFQKVFLHQIGQLQALGFDDCEYLQIEAMFKQSSFFDWGVLLLNQECHTCAVVSIKFFSESVDLFKINFYSFLDGDRVLLTMNGDKHGLVDAMPGFFVEDNYAVNIDEQWQTHQQKLAELSSGDSQLPQLTVEEYITKIINHSQKYINYLNAQNKLISQAKNNYFKLELRTVAKLTYSLLQGNKRIGKMLKRKRRLAQSNPDLAIDIAPEIEVEAFKRIEELNRGLVSKKARTWILFISLAISICILAVAQWFDGLDLLIFLSVLAFHELGHILAMKFFGYRDTSVLFIPFFGALATGTKEDATLTEKFWVSFVGPLPGLILGIILLFVNQGQNSGWQHQVSFFLIILNLFNLLPIYPLDGGQIADLLIFSGFPYLGVFFRGLGVLLLGLLGIAGSPLLLLFAVMIALTIPGSFRTARANRKMRCLRLASQSHLQPAKSQNQGDILLAIFKNADSDYRDLPFNTRYSLAKALLQRHHESSAKLVTKIFLTALYSVTLVGGILSGFNLMIPGGINSLRYLGETPQQAHIRLQTERQEIVARATLDIEQNPHNIEAYLARANVLQAVDEAQRLEDYEQIVRLKPDNIEYRLTRGFLREIAGKDRAAIADYDYVLERDTKNTRAYYGKAKALTELKDYPAAIENYDLIIALDNQNTAAYYFRADVFNKTSEYSKAIADYTQITKLDPNDDWAYCSRGEVELKLKNYQAAVDDANRAISLNAENADAYSLRSQVKAALGDRQGAEADRKIAKRLYEYY